MMDMIYVVLLCVLAGLLLVAVFLVVAQDKLHELVERRERRKHPERYALIDKLKRMEKELANYHRTYIDGVRNTIAHQVEERIYIPASELEAYDSMLDALRRQLRDNNREYNRMLYEYKQKENTIIN